MYQMGLARNYFYGVDRNHFDEALWKQAAQAAGVTANAGFAVTQILKDANGDVTGIAGQASGRPAETYTADLIVGADGRFSFAAREFGAKVIDELNQHTTAVYHAEWENVEAYSADHPHAVTNYNTGKSFQVLVIPTAERRYLIGTYMRSQDAHFGAQGIEQAYINGLQRIPHLWNRLKNAQRITDIVGIRPIENGYRAAYGAHWALVGDAVHYKDPSDGQGIYDALLESKLLAESILAWKQQGLAWMQAGAIYQQRLMDATHRMYQQTVANVKQTVFTQPPGFIINTLIRYGVSDPEFQTQFLRYLSRAIDPAAFTTGPAVFMKIFMRGVIGDLRRRIWR
jgi:flavin-dependent dehydrogenase